MDRKLPCACAALLLTVLTASGCYRLHPTGTDSSESLPIDAQYRVHSEQPPLLNAVCGNDLGDLWAMGDHGASFQASLDNLVWQQSELLAATINDCAAYKNGFVAVGSAGSVYFLEKGGSWVQVRSRTDVSLNAISIDGDMIFVGGDRGTIRTSSDGKEWTARNIQTPSNVTSLARCGRNLYAAGSDGHVWSSTDLAKSWEDHPTPLKAAKSVACEADSSTLLASSYDGHFARSENRGITWTDIDTHQDMQINSMLFLGDHHWVAVGNNGLGFESTNDGLNWSVLQVSTNNNLTSIRGFRTTLLAAGGRKTILKGDRIQYLTPILGASFGINGLIPFRSIGMLGYGPGGDVFRFAQNQQPVKLANVGTSHDIRGAVVSDAAHRIVVATNFGHVFSSVDGTSWAEISPPLASHDNRIDFVAVDMSSDGKRIGVVDSEGDVFLTSNGGGHWSACTHPGDAKPNTIVLLGDKTVIVAGNHSIRTSVDSGTTWKEFPKATLQNMLASSHDTSGIVIIVGTNGDILESFNSGETWSDPGKDTREQNTLRAITCLQTCATIVAAGDGGAAWMSSEHGHGWSALSEPPLDYRDLKWMDGKLWVLLPDGSVRVVDDASKPWTEGATADINSLAQSSDALWSLDSDGGLSMSADRGVTWSPVSINPPGHVRAISASPSDKSMYLVGSKSLIAYSANASDSTRPFRVETVTGGITSSLGVVERIRGAVLAGGTGGTIFRKPEDGSAWETTKVPSPARTISAFAADADGRGIWAFGESGTILHSSNSGSTWFPQVSPTDSDWNAAIYVQGPYGPRVLCFGTGGGIAITDDLGEHWIPRFTSYGDIQAAVFVSSMKGIWAVTSTGVLLNSADFGENWGHTDMNTPGSANAIIQTNSGQNLLVGGDSGFLNLMNLIGRLESVGGIETTITAQDLTVSFTVADSKFVGDPNFSLRIARGPEPTSGVYQTLPVSTKAADVSGGRRYILTASLLGLNPQSGELFWITPCMSWPTYARCLSLHPAEIVPILNYRDHPKAWGIVTGCLSFVLCQSILLLIAPYYNIRLFLLFRSFEDLVKDKVPFGVWIVRVYRMFLIPLFAFSGRALDAWMRRYGARLQPSRDDWTNYQPLPINVSVNGKSEHISQPGPPALSAIGTEREISIVGPGGAGKTTLARQISLWLQDDNDFTKKLGAKPVSLFLGDGQPKVVDAIQSLMQDRLNMEVDQELITALLRKGRLAIVLDGLSERSEIAEAYRQELRIRVFARIIITTSRTEFDRAYSSAAVIKPTTLSSESLVGLVKSILSHRVHAETGALDKMSIQLAVATQLAKMVESTQRGVTPLLVEAFVRQAERLIAEERSLDELPRSVAAAYLGYVRELTSRGGPAANHFQLMKTTLRVASLCIGDEYRPCAAEYGRVVSTLDREGLVEEHVVVLSRLGLLKILDYDVPVRIRFELDPIAEYCAVEYWRENTSVNEWNDIRDKAESRLPISAGVVRAMEDVEKYVATSAS